MPDDALSPSSPSQYGSPRAFKHSSNLLSNGKRSQEDDSEMATPPPSFFKRPRFMGARNPKIENKEESLILHTSMEVKWTSPFAVANGAYGSIFCGTYDGQLVALKQLKRVAHRPDKVIRVSA